MPLAEIIEKPDFRVGWWTIAESADDLYNKVTLSSEEQRKFVQFKSDKRRIQWLAIRALLPLVANRHNCIIRYGELGQPTCDLGKLSISHSGKIVAVQISSAEYCGIDVQQHSPKMLRLAPKFINNFENDFIPENRKAEYCNLIWTMKEAIFKHFGTEVAFLSQIEIQPFDISIDQKVCAEVNQSGKQHHIQLEWRQIDDYFLSYLC